MVFYESKSSENSQEVRPGVLPSEYGRNACNTVHTPRYALLRLVQKFPLFFYCVDIKTVTTTASKKNKNKNNDHD
jgi:hypothetical protein